MSNEELGNFYDPENERYISSGGENRKKRTSKGSRKLKKYGGTPLTVGLQLGGAPITTPGFFDSSKSSPPIKGGKSRKSKKNRKNKKSRKSCKKCKFFFF